MADLQWPTNLRPALKSSKRRMETVGFRESDVTSGPSFIEPFSEDTPSIYDVKFTFTKGEAKAFQIWLRQNRIKTYSPFFDFPLSVEDGRTPTQEARFTYDGYPQLTSETGFTYTYSASLLIRQIENDYSDYDDFIYQLEVVTGYKGNQWLSGFDTVINTDYSAL